MPLIDEQNLQAQAEKKLSYRLTGVTTKLNPGEVAEVERLAKKRGQSRGELIRHLILEELARDAHEQVATAELTEITGIRLLLTNALRAIATGQKMTPEVFDGLLAEVKKRKKTLAVEAQHEAQAAS